MKKRVMVFSILVIVLLATSISAGIFDFLKPSGKASSGTQGVSVTVAGTNPPSIEQPSSSMGTVIPLENTSTQVGFAVWVTDIDGVANINDSSLLVRVSRNASIKTATCLNPSNVDSNTRSYNCSITMQYYDSAGSWDLYAEAKDQEANSGNRTLTGFFTYSILMAMQTPLSPSTLSWPSLSPSATNVLSNNDPTIVVNTGNYAGNIFLTAYDLIGQTTPSEKILASSFSVDSSTGGVPPSECDTGVTAIALSNSTAIDTGIYANPGAQGSNTANIYYCMTTVPLVSSQTYSTAGSNNWVVAYQ